MKEKSNALLTLSSTLMTFVGTIVVNNIGALEFLLKDVDEPYKTYISAGLSLVVGGFFIYKLLRFVFAKNGKLKDFLIKHKTKFILALVLGSCFVFVLKMGDNAFKISDSSIPTIMVKPPENNIVAAKQYDSPLVYHVYFDDETELKEINFSAESIDLGDVTADIQINKVTDNEYALTLSNIVGETGAHFITLKDGIAKDIANNVTESVDCRKFYLYNNENEIDREAPEINFTQNNTTENTAQFNVNITDNNEIYRTTLTEKNIILVGFSADILIERDLHNYTIKLSNIEKHDDNFMVILTSGVATDTWDNSTEYCINTVNL